MARTKVEAVLQAREEEVAGEDPERAELLRLARSFKGTWIDLAAALTEARRTRVYERWGYDSFDDYARRELALSKATADKLTQSFGFLQSKAPEYTRLTARHVAAPGFEAEDGDGERQLPSYQAVDFWRRAEEAGAADDKTMGALGDEVLGGATPALLRRRYGEAAFPANDDDRDERSRRAALAAAQRLADVLPDCRGLGKGLVKEAEGVLGRLIETLRRKEPAAASNE
jgi:hypothetical protein